CLRRVMHTSLSSLRCPPPPTSPLFPYTTLFRSTRPQKEQEGTRMARTEAEIITGLAEIVEEVTGIEPSEVTPEKSFVDDLDIDSLSMVEIAVQTEDRYGVEIPDEDLAKLRTVRDAVDYIQKIAKS